MAARVYNNTIRVRLYELLLDEIGPFDRNNWRITSADRSPTNYTTTQTIELYDQMYDRMVNKDRLFEKEEMTAPSPNEGLPKQVDWCTTTQDVHRMNKGQLKMQRQNRLAAYEAGWMSMDDIVFLERTAAALALAKTEKPERGRPRHAHSKVRGKYRHHD